MVEAAFVAPVFFMLIFGVIEFGFVFKDRLTVDNSTREGSRAASVSGDDLESDFLILQSINHSLKSVNRPQIEEIIIYRADSPDSPIPAACLSSGAQSGPVDFCNVYSPDAFDEPLYDNLGAANDFFGCVAATSADRHWCPSDRDSSLSGAPPDYVGVYVRVNHPFITGFFGDALTLTQVSVNRIEPSSR